MRATPWWLMQGKYEEAVPYFERSLAMREKLLGCEHPAVQTSLNNLAALYNRCVLRPAVHPACRHYMFRWPKQPTVDRTYC
eukprot:762295-Pyramimonas_sp.AAC.1